MGRSMGNSVRRKGGPRIYRAPDRTGAHRSTEIKPRKSSSWPEHDDKKLMEMRSQSHSWTIIADAFGKTADGAYVKSSNACRKRYERLSQYETFQKVLEKWTEEEIANAYIDVREQMWRILADKLGTEHIDALEAGLFSKGLRTIHQLDRRGKNIDDDMVSKHDSLSPNMDVIDHDPYRYSHDTGMVPLRPHTDSQHNAVSIAPQLPPPQYATHDYYHQQQAPQHNHHPYSHPMQQNLPQPQLIQSRQQHMYNPYPSHVTHHPQHLSPHSHHHQQDPSVNNRIVSVSSMIHHSQH